MLRLGLLALVTALACSRGAPAPLPGPVSEASIRVTDLSKNPDFPLYYADISLPEAAWVTLIGIRPSGELFAVGRSQNHYRAFPAGTRRVRLGIGGPPFLPGSRAYSTPCGGGISMAYPPIGAHLTPDQAAALGSGQYGSGASNSKGLGPEYARGFNSDCSDFTWHPGILVPPRLSKLVMLLTPHPIRWVQDDQAGIGIEGRTTGMDAAKSLALRYNAVLVEEVSRP